MTNPGAFPDEVPFADAAEQARPAADPAEPDFGDDGSAPLESDAADWQEQRIDVEDAGEDDFR